MLAKEPPQKKNSTNANKPIELSFIDTDNDGEKNGQYINSIEVCKLHVAEYNFIAVFYQNKYKISIRL